MIALILIVSIVVIYSIWIYFGKSLEDIQYFHNKLLELDWGKSMYVSFNLFEYNTTESLSMLRYCVFSSVVYANNFSCVLNRTFKKIYKLYDTKEINVGFMTKNDNHFVVTLVSTANLGDVLVSADTNLIDIEDGQVHKGYYNHTLELICPILKVLALYPNVRNIFITGHSMGGALACLVGYFINKHIGNYNIKIYTYGSPKYGNKQLKYYLENQERLKIFNVMNSFDIIIKKPLFWKYTTIGEKIVHSIDTGNDNVNHGIKVYRECVLKVKETLIPRRAHRFDEIIFKIVLDLFS
jgi:triacylglycerol lipase